MFPFANNCSARGFLMYYKTNTDAESQQVMKDDTTTQTSSNSTSDSSSYRAPPKKNSKEKVKEAEVLEGEIIDEPHKSK